MKKIQCYDKLITFEKYDHVTLPYANQSIYKFSLSVWVFVRLYPKNVITAEPIGPKFVVGHHVTTGKVNE